MYSPCPFQLLFTKRSEILRHQTPAHDDRIIYRFPSGGMDADCSDQIFCQANAVASGGVKGFASECAVGADGNAAIVTEQAHLRGAVKRIGLFGRSSCRERAVL